MTGRAFMGIVFIFLLSESFIVGIMALRLWRHRSSYFAQSFAWFFAMMVANRGCQFISNLYRPRALQYSLPFTVFWVIGWLLETAGAWWLMGRLEGGGITHMPKEEKIKGKLKDQPVPANADEPPPDNGDDNGDPPVPPDVPPGNDGE